MKKYVAIYFGFQRWSGRNIERGIVFQTIAQLEEWMSTTTTYCNPNWPSLQLNEGSREKVEQWMLNPERPLFFKTTGCGSWEIKLDTTDCNIFDEYRQQRDEAESKRVHEREQRRLAELSKSRKGWYRVTIELTGDGITTPSHTCKDFSGDVIATNGADAWHKAVAECQNIAPGFFPADMLSGGYTFEFLGVKTDEGYSVELWEKWKGDGVI